MIFKERRTDCEWKQGYAGAGNTVDYSVFNPFNSENYFHSYCEITDYSNLTMVEKCWEGDTIVSLPDLNTESTTVQNIWNDWITDLVSNYSSKIHQFAMKMVTNVYQSRRPAHRFCYGSSEGLLGWLRSCRWSLLCRRGRQR